MQIVPLPGNVRLVWIEVWDRDYGISPILGIANGNDHMDYVVGKGWDLSPSLLSDVLVDTDGFSVVLSPHWAPSEDEDEFYDFVAAIRNSGEYRSYQASRQELSEPQLKQPTLY